MQRSHRPNRTATIQGRTVHQDDVWTVNWVTSTFRRRWFVRDGFMWAPVTKVEQRPETRVFNIEVEEEHTFVADGLVVHNCAMAVSKWSFDAGLPIPATTSKGYAYCPSGVAYFQRLGRFSDQPSVGDHVFFSFPGEGAGANHVGLVEKVLGNGAIQTIEGNTDDAVMRRNRKSFVVGYGHPPYGGGSSSGPGFPIAEALSKPASAIVSTASGNGYWLIAEDGGVFTFGDARYFGSMGGRPLNAPVIGAAAHPGGDGYWLVGADGGVFNFGSAKFFGSMSGQPLIAPIRGIVAHPGSNGYWLVGADGGVFGFGEAQFHGNPHQL